MAHWSERYIGRAYVAGEFDCAHLVVLVQREQFRRQINLPVHATSIRARDAQINALSGDYARRRRGDESAQEGDAVLMRRAGRRRVSGHHIGLYVWAGSQAHVLHCQAGLGTCLHTLADLPHRGLEMTGIYQWL